MIVSTLQVEYLHKLLGELGFGQSTETEQQKVLQLLSDRFERVAMLTLLGLLNEDQKERLSEALDNPASAEDEVALLAAEVPGFDQVLEQALVDEYEIIKFAMGKA